MRSKGLLTDSTLAVQWVDRLMTRIMRYNKTYVHEKFLEHVKSSECCDGNASQIL